MLKSIALECLWAAALHIVQPKLTPSFLFILYTCVTICFKLLRSAKPIQNVNVLSGLLKSILTIGPTIYILHEICAWYVVKIALYWQNMTPFFFSIRNGDADTSFPAQLK